MKICSKCGKVLGDDEMLCPECFADAIDNEKTDIQTFDAMSDNFTESGEILPEPETIVRAEFSAPAQDASLFVSDETEDESKGAADELLNSGNGGIKKLILSLAVIALIGAIAGIIIPLVRLRSDSDTANRKAYLSYLSSSWISDAFIYADGENPSRELLTLNKDMTYISIIVTSPDSSEDYNPGTWTVTDKSEGTFTIDVENASIEITCEINGQEYTYLRHIRKLSADCLVLREYYNEQLTDYFDVTFREGE